VRFMDRRKFLKLVPMAATMLFMPRNLLAVSDKQNQIIMKAVERLYIRKEPVDLITIAHELKLNGDLSRIGGCDYLCSLLD
jgi:hypothetical protein